MARWIVGAVVTAVCGAVAIVPAETPDPSARQGVRVTGTVVDAYPGATPVPTAVTLSKELGSAGFGIPLRRADVLQNRSFVFDDVPPGTYRLSTTIGSEVVVPVGAVDVAGVQLRHVGLTELFTSVQMEDGSEVPSRVEFHLEMGEGKVLAGSLLREAPIVLPPGRRFFFVQPPEGVYVRSVTSAGVDLLRQPLVVEARAPERGMQIVLTRIAARAPGLAKVRGHVAGGAGALTVQLTPTMFSQRKLASASVGVAPDGSFDVELEPGIYDVHVPPANRTVRGLVVPLAGTTIDVALPKGRLFGGSSVRVIDPKGQSLPYSIGPVVLVARSADGVSRFPVEVPGFWGALPPGEHRLTLEHLPAHVSVATLEAGGRDLLELPYVVTNDRNPPRITLVLKYSGPVPDWATGPSRSLGETLVPGGGSR